MPRLTNTNYLEHRQGLRLLIDHLPETFSVLPPFEQLYLHTYFQTATVAPEEVLIRNRQTLTRFYPSLPQRAGKSARYIERVLEIAVANDLLDDVNYNDLLALMAKPNAVVSSLVESQTGMRKIGVRAAVRPDIDAEALARTLVLAARHKDDLAA